VSTTKGKPASKSTRTSKRQLIAPRGDKRYIRRDAKGRIKESDDLSRSLSADRRRKAKTVVPKGQGDHGDQKRSRPRRSTTSATKRSPKREN
jgi:hypothetical protein